MEYFKSSTEDFAYVFLIVKTPNNPSHNTCLMWNKRTQSLQWYNSNIDTEHSLFVLLTDRFFDLIKDMYPNIRIVDSLDIHENAGFINSNSLNSYFYEKKNHGACILFSFLIIYFRMKYPSTKLCDIVKSIHEYANVENITHIVNGLKFLLDESIKSKTDDEIFDILSH